MANPFHPKSKNCFHKLIISSILKIAHRGASGHALENSIASLKKAIELGADIIEADIQLTKDDVPIIMHDRLLDRTSNASGYTTDFTSEQIDQSIRLKNGERIPSLEEFCQLIAKSRSKLYIDLKTVGIESNIVGICKKYLTINQFYIGSFHNHSIKLIKESDKNVQTIMIMEGNPIDVAQVIENAGCDIVAMGFETVEASSIKVAQEMGKKVFVWVVNDSREIQRAKALKVDGITSDFPERI